MELGSLVGFISGMFFIIMSLLLSANFDVSKVVSIIDAPSVMITIGGSIAATLIAYPIPVMMSGFKQIGRVFKPPSDSPAEVINNIIKLANLARREGLLALEEASNSMEEPFLKKGIMLVVDGTDQELVRNILETDMSFIEERHTKLRGVWDFWGMVAPAFGMVGTLIGLIMMLQDLSDSATLGPKMAIAMITTFYGSIIANYICAPVSNKLKSFTETEMLLKEIMIEGILGIQSGENPRIIEEKLKSFLSPTLRATLSPDGGEK